MVQRRYTDEEARSLVTLLEAIAFEKADWKDLDRARLAVALAVEAQPLAHLLSLLDRRSRSSRELQEALKELDRKEQRAEETRQVNRFWRQKFSPEDLDIALGQARNLEGNFWAFATPTFWRLRKSLAVAYDMTQHQVRPTRLQVLTRLHEEYEAERELKRESRHVAERFAEGFGGSMELFTEALERLRCGYEGEGFDAKGVSTETTGGDHHSAGGESAWDERTSEADSPRETARRVLHFFSQTHDRHLVERLASLQSTLESLARHLTELFLDAGRRALEELPEAIERHLGDLDQLPAFLPCLKQMACLETELAICFHRQPWTPDQVESLLIQRSLEALHLEGLPSPGREAREEQLGRLGQCVGALRRANVDYLLKTTEDCLDGALRSASAPMLISSRRQRAKETL